MRHDVWTLGNISKGSKSDDDQFGKYLPISTAGIGINSKILQGGFHKLAPIVVLQLPFRQHYLVKVVLGILSPCIEVKGINRCKISRNAQEKDVSLYYAMTLDSQPPYRIGNM